MRIQNSTVDSSPDRTRGGTSRGKKRTDRSSANSTAATAINAGKKGFGYFSKAEITN